MSGIALLMRELAGVDCHWFKDAINKLNFGETLTIVQMSCRGGEQLISTIGGIWGVSGGLNLMVNSAVTIKWDIYTVRGNWMGEKLLEGGVIYVKPLVILFTC